MQLPLSVTQSKTYFQSPRYTHVPSMLVVDTLAKEGWLPVKVQETRTLDPARQGFQKHLIRFRQETKSLVKKDDLFPEVVFINSHDGRTAPQLHAGCFRLVCTNGLIVSDFLVESLRLRHLHGVVDQLLAALARITAAFPRLAARVRDYQAIELAPNEQGVFVEQALAVRYLDPAKRDAVDRAELLRPRRPEDAAPTLWHVFQRLQEKLVGGGTTFTDRRYRTARQGLTSIDEVARVNIELWALVERWASR